MVRVIDVTGTRVDVEAFVAAEPGVVWDLLADITRVSDWSPECVYTAWLDEVRQAREGARFAGRNRARNGFEWSVTRCELDPLTGGGTRVRESFVHGPGASGLRWMAEQDPERAGVIIADRQRWLRDNIARTLAGMKAVAEAG
jgi:hypothetical protein